MSIEYIYTYGKEKISTALSQIEINKQRNEPTFIILVEVEDEQRLHSSLYVVSFVEWRH